MLDCIALVKSSINRMTSLYTNFDYFLGIFIATGLVFTKFQRVSIPFLVDPALSKGCLGIPLRAYVSGRLYFNGNDLAPAQG